MSSPPLSARPAHRIRLRCPVPPSATGDVDLSGLTIARAEVPLLHLLDGSGDLDTIVQRAGALTPRQGPLDVLALLVRLQESGLLDGWHRMPLTSRLRAEARLPTLALPLHLGRFLPRALPALLLALSTAALFLVLLWAFGRHALQALWTPFDSSQPTWWVLGRLWLAAAGLVSLRSLARGLVLARAGHTASEVWLRAQRGLLWIGLGERLSTAVTRADRLRLAWAGLATCAGVAALASGTWLFTHAEWARQIGGVALWALLYDTAPYLLDTDGEEAVSLAARVPSLRRRARAWLMRRALRNLLDQKAITPVERAYLWVATAWLAHGLLVLALLETWLLPAAIALALRSAAQRDGLGGLVPALLVVGLLLVLLGTLAFVAVQLLRQLRPTRGSEPPSSVAALDADEVADFAEAAVGIPFLARLGQDALRSLAAVVQRAQYAPGALILRQGEPGERFCFVAAGRVAVEVEEESGLRRRAASLGAGDFFGEAALVQAVPRSASVRATAATTLYTLTRDQFLLAAHSAGADSDEIAAQIRNAAYLRSHPLFDGLPSTALRRLLERVEVVPCPSARTIIRQGESGDTLYVIREGRCWVSREGSEARTAMEPGSWFGELALLHHTPRSATVVADPGTVLIGVPREAAEEVMLQDVGTAFQLADVAAERLTAFEMEVLA